MHKGFVTWTPQFTDISEKTKLLFRVSIPASHHHSVISLTPPTIRFCVKVKRREKKRYVLTKVPPGTQPMCHCQEKFATGNAGADSHVPIFSPTLSFEECTFAKES